MFGYKKKLENVREYSCSEIRRNGKAIILNLKSKDWSFDMVSCFHTVNENDGRSYYLIPMVVGIGRRLILIRIRNCCHDV